MSFGFRLGLRFILLLMGLLVGLPADSAWAHGGGVPQLTNVEVGPYWVSVWTQPDPLRVGQVHVTVAVSEPTDSGSARREAGSPVLDATVQVAFEPLDHAGEALVVPATHEGAANKLFYETDLELPETGRWRVVVTVEGPDGVGSASFEVQISPPSTFSWTWVGGGGLVALVAVWMVQKYRDQKRNE